MSSADEFSGLVDQIVTKFDDLEKSMIPLRDAANELPADSDACQPVRSAVEDLNALAPEVKEAIDEVAKGKVWIGIVGHYSHGKSSLLNALLQNPDAPELLPTGDGVVTGLVSRLEFSARRSAHGFRMLRGAESTELAEDEYRARVAGRSDIAGIYAFDLELATRELASSDLWESMDRKGIALFDTPGLGGPYFSDANQVSQWMREFMLLVVCVRADAISDEVSANLTPFLREAPKKMLPVFTFWDRWRESPDFEGISSEERARNRARELLASRFPMLADQAHRASFVSARNYMLKREPSAEDSKLLSHAWNIDALRNTLYQEVDPSILGRGRKLTPFESHRAGRLHKRLRASQVQIEGSLKRIASEIEKTRHTVSDTDSPEESLDSVQDKLFREYDRLASEIEDEVTPIAQEVGHGKTMFAALDEMKRASTNPSNEFARSLGRVAKQELEAKVTRTIEKQLDKSPLTRDRTERLRQDAQRACKGFVANIQDLDFRSAFKSPDMTGLALKGALETLKMMVNIAQNPQALQSLVVIGVFLILGPVLIGIAEIPLLPEKMKDVLRLIAFFMPCIGFIAFAFLFQSERRRAKEAVYSDFRQRVRGMNARDVIRRRIELVVEGEWSTLKERVRDIGDAMEQGGDNVHATLKTIQRHMRSTGDHVRDISVLAERLARKMG
jgi:HD-GYP domain-containing protein (c-di-GMP phosphodiesterase class II)